MIYQAITQLYEEVNKASLCYEALKVMPNVEVYVLNEDGTLFDSFGGDSKRDREIDDSFLIKIYKDKIIAYRVNK